MKTLVVRVSGGLGNQMFEYALGLAVAQRTGRALRLDLTDFLVFRGGRTYQLDQFRGLVVALQAEVLVMEQLAHLDRAVRMTLPSQLPRQCPVTSPKWRSPVREDDGLLFHAKTIRSSVIYERRQRTQDNAQIMPI